MITRHHISLACGSTLLMYLPFALDNPFMLAVLVIGTGIGAVIPDIQMKRPKDLSLLYIVWFLVQVFKKTLLQIYITLCALVLGFRPEADDKRLTHSVPGLLYLAVVITLLNVLAIALFPSGLAVHILRILSAGILIGLVFHFLEDVCTMKGLCIMYPFDESCRIAGSIRPCNREDLRIRRFHLMTAGAIGLVVLLFGTGICPENLMWPLSMAALFVCTAMMILHADVRVTTSA